jgi:4,5-DOPA dioxygenase extradiol
MNPGNTHSDELLPVLFVGHGSPMNAIEDNVWSRSFRALARQLPRPKAILAVSAHWFVSGTFLTGNARPETIHDFGGFPPELYAIKYPAPGDEELARQIALRLKAHRTALAFDWGVDHGTWTVLRHLFPEADVPVVQLSIDAKIEASGHLEIGRALAPLRADGVLIMGSGNITHNLQHAMSNYGRNDPATPDWARSFDEDVARAIERHDDETLTRIIYSDNGRMSHPSPDHYLPLLYATGAAMDRDTVQFPITGFDMASLSMRSVLLA